MHLFQLLLRKFFPQLPRPRCILRQESHPFVRSRVHETDIIAFFHIYGFNGKLGEDEGYDEPLSNRCSGEEGARALLHDAVVNFSPLEENG